MKKNLMILLIFLSIIQMYGDGFMCKKNKIKTENSCWKKEILSKIEKKHYCEKSSVSKKEYCVKWQHSTWTTSSSTHFSIINITATDFNNNNSHFSFEKSKFHPLQAVISSLIYPIWIIPKIS